MRSTTKHRNSAPSQGRVASLRHHLGPVEKSFSDSCELSAKIFPCLPTYIFHRHKPYAHVCQFPPILLCPGRLDQPMNGIARTGNLHAPRPPKSVQNKCLIIDSWTSTSDDQMESNNCSSSTQEGMIAATTFAILQHSACATNGSMSYLFIKARPLSRARGPQSCTD